MTKKSSFGGHKQTSDHVLLLLMLIAVNFGAGVHECCGSLKGDHWPV